MIDLHCHILPGIDDGAPDDATAVAMARMFVADGVTTVACTPHILPGLYHNSGPQIRDAVTRLELKFMEQGIDLAIVPGADAHICPSFVQDLKSGAIPTLGNSRYVLVEPPHHTAPQRIEQFFFDILVAGYVPILTHPERLTWINQQYETMQRLVAKGVWMQITAGSLTGAFGKNAQYWAERMLDEGAVHILATDAHEAHRRLPNLGRGRDAAAKRVGELEAQHLVLTRPRGVLANEAPNTFPAPAGIDRSNGAGSRDVARSSDDAKAHDDRSRSGRADGTGGWSQRLRRLFE
ncbi:MAG: CpsB/CapC family capsule biosynthesis tyrosine phosphatase [Hyphomicrobium sp.]